MYSRYNNGGSFNPNLTEGVEHKFAKFMIYNIIKNNSKKIVDNYGNEVNFFENINGEFLHIESPVYKIGNIPTNKTLYGNKDSGCTSGVDRDFRKFIPMCGFEYEYGCIGVIPCWTCYEYNKYNKMNLNVGYIADISYGIYDTHKKWIEIVNYNDVSEHKIRFCLNNNIEIYKIHVKNINYDLDFLELHRLDEKYMERFDIIRQEKYMEVESELKNIICSKGYMMHKEFKEVIQSISRSKEENDNYYNKFIENNDLVVFTFGKSKKEISIVKNLDLYKEFGHKKILISKKILEEYKNKISGFYDVLNIDNVDYI